MHGLAFALLVITAGGTTDRGDWPQWRGPARDGAAAARASWPAALTTVWQAPVGIGHSSPVVADGRVFLFSREGEEETLQAFDLATGKRLWRQAQVAPYTVSGAASAHGKGPKSTPVVSDGRIFTFGISGILSAHDAASGRLLWRKLGQQFPATSPLYGTAQSPLVDRGRLIVHIGGDGNGALSAFDVATGRVLWSWKDDGPGYSSPVVADIGGVRQVVTFTEKNLVGVAVDSGQLLWRLPFTTAYTQNAVTPVVDGDGVIFSGLDHPVRAVRIRNSGGRWETTPLWENAEVAAYMSTPVLAGRRLFGFSHRRKGQFFALDADTGKTLWLSDGRQGDNASLAAAGAVLALSTEGTLIVMDAAAPAFNVLRRYRVADTPTWAHLAVVPEGLLVKDENNLAYLRF